MKKNIEEQLDIVFETSGALIDKIKAFSAMCECGGQYKTEYFTWSGTIPGWDYRTSFTVDSRCLLCGACVITHGVDGWMNPGKKITRKYNKMVFDDIINDLEWLISQNNKYIETNPDTDKPIRIGYV